METVGYLAVFIFAGIGVFYVMSCVWNELLNDKFDPLG